jgi:uridine kinase
MEQLDVDTEQAKRAGEWDAARMKLQNLIDNPERHLPVIDYIEHIRDAQKAVARAYKAMQAVGA